MEMTYLVAEPTLNFRGRKSVTGTDQLDETIMQKASQLSEKLLLRGFTSVRDVGGPSFLLKNAIDKGSNPQITLLSWFPIGFEQTEICQSVQ
jgi:hypothetical protein